MDINALKAFDTELQNGKTYSEAYKSSITSTNKETRLQAVAFAKSGKSIQSFVKGLGQVTFAAKAGQAALGVFAGLSNGLFSIAVSKGIELAAKAISDYIHRLDIAKETLRNTEAEISSLSSEIEDTRSKIKELEALDPSALSITDKEDLQRLKDQNEELRIRRQYLKDQKQKDLESVADLTKEKYNLRYSGSVNRDDIDRYKELYNTPEQQPSVPGYLTGNSSSQSTPYAPGLQADKLNSESKSLANLIAKYEYYNAEKKKAVQSEDEEAIAKYNLKIIETGEELQTARTELQGLSDDMSATGETSSELFDANNKLKLIDDTLLTKGRNLVDFINNETLEENKTKLIELANSGKLTSHELSASFSDVDDYLKENGHTFEDLISTIKIYEEELSSAQNAPALSVSGTITKISTQLQPAFGSLKSAYQSIFTEDGFTLGNADFDMIENIRSSIDAIDQIEGIDIDYSSFDDLVRTLNNTEATEEEVENAFNDLAATISQVVISGAEDFETLRAALEYFGIENGEMVVFSNLVNNAEALKEAGLDIANASKEQIEAFAEEYVSAENVARAIDILTFAKQTSKAENMDTAAEVSNLKILAENAGYSGQAIQYLIELEQIYKDLGNGVISPESVEEKLTRARKLQGLIEESANKVNYAQAAYGNTPNTDTSNTNTAPAAKAGASAADAYLEAFEKELSQLDGLKDRGKITEKQYLDALRKLYVKYYKDKEKYIDQYEKYEHQYLSGMKSMYESAFSYITKLIDKRIDALQKESNSQVTGLEAQKKASEDYYQSQIDEIDGQIKAKQELIDAINEAAEARKREIDLQKAQYDLERMQNQRTTYVYKEGKGFVYEADTSGIADARERVESAKREIEVSNIQKSIDGLEKQKEALEEALEASNAYWDTQIEQTKNYFDSLISGMEEYKSRWTELSELQENAEMLNLLQELGYTEEEILNMSSGAFEDFKQKYLGILKDMSDGNQGLMNSLSEIANIDMGKVPGYLKETQEYIDSLSNMNVEALSESVNAVGEGFGSVAEAAGKVSSVLTGNSGTGMNSPSADGGAPQSNNGGTGGSLKTAINTFSTDGVNDINKVAAAFAGENTDGESGVSVASAVQQVIDKVGSGSAKPDDPGSEAESDSGSLMSAIEQQTAAALNKESGIPAQVTAWKELNTPLKEADDYITSIKDSLTDMDGKTFTITLDVNGGASHGGGGSSRGENGTVGKAFSDGSTDYHNIRNLPITGYKGLPSNEKNALRSEYGQPELTVYPNGITELTTEPVMSDLPKGTVIFNEEQTLRIMKNKGKIIGSAYAHGTSSNLPSYLTPIDLTSENNSIFRKFSEYIGTNIAALTPSMDVFKSNLESINSNFNSMVQNNQGPQSMNQVFNITMPNVTNSTSAETLMRDLQSLGTKKMQFFN